MMPRKASITAGSCMRARLIKTSSVMEKPSLLSDISDVSFFPGVAVEASTVVVS